MILCLVTMTALGCASTASLEPPEVTLVDLDFVDATIFESTLDVAVRLTNNNPEPIIVDGAVIKLELDGRNVGKGSLAARVEIPRFDSVIEHLELYVNHVAIATKVKGVIDRKVVSYAVTGKVYILTPSGGTRRLPIDSRGTLDLRGGGPLEFQDDPPANESVD